MVCLHKVITSLSAPEVVETPSFGGLQKVPGHGPGHTAVGILACVLELDKVPRCPFQAYPFSDFELHQALIIQLRAAGIWNPRDIWYSLQYDHGLATSPCDKWSLFSNQSQTEGQSSGWKPAWVSGDQHLLHKGQCKLVHLASLVLICEITALPKYLSVLREGMFWGLISPIITPSSKEGCLAFWNGQVNNAVPSLPPLNNVFTSSSQRTIHHALISFHARL